MKSICEGQHEPVNEDASGRTLFAQALSVACFNGVTKISQGPAHQARHQARRLHEVAAVTQSGQCWPMTQVNQVNQGGAEQRALKLVLLRPKPSQATPLSRPCSETYATWRDCSVTCWECHCVTPYDFVTICYHMHPQDALLEPETKSWNQLGNLGRSSSVKWGHVPSHQAHP